MYIISATYKADYDDTWFVVCGVTETKGEADEIAEKAEASEKGYFNVYITPILEKGFNFYEVEVNTPSY